MFDFWQSLTTALERVVMLPSLIQTVFPSLPAPKRVRDVVRSCDRTMDDFLREVQRLFEAPLKSTSLLAMSGKLQEQFEQKLQTSNICMLPSYNHTLPTGHEEGTYLALDVGGSTFRIALVELNGKDSAGKSMRIANMRSYRIDNSVRALKGHSFFDWMAEKIEEAIADPEVKKINGTSTLPMGLAWSFPVEFVQSILSQLKHLINQFFRQTSIRSGMLLEMGKGFRATEGTLGQDLSELIMRPCRSRVSITSTFSKSPGTHLDFTGSQRPHGFDRQ